MVHALLIGGHAAIGLVFTLQGLWHLLKTITTFVEGEPQQRRPWHPVLIGENSKTFAGKMLREAELQVLLWGSLIFFAVALWNAFLDGHTSNIIINYQHCSVFLFIALYAAAAIAAESFIISFPLILSVLHLLHGLAFAHAILPIYTHTAGAEVERHYHWLLELAMAAVATCSLLRIAFPTSFIVCFARSLSMVVQGAWSLLLGMFLWVPSFVAQGCKTGMLQDELHPTVICGSSPATMRATTIATLQFSFLLIGVVSLGTVATLLQLSLKSGGGTKMSSSEDDRASPLDRDANLSQRVTCPCNQCKFGVRRQRRVMLQHVRDYGSFDPNTIDQAIADFNTLGSNSKHTPINLQPVRQARMRSTHHIGPSALHPMTPSSPAAHTIKVAPLEESDEDPSDMMLESKMNDMVEAIFEATDPTADDMKQETRTALYEGSRISRLKTVLALLNL
ncbi:hypothetical protein L7F22_030426 [Adiantum nelumboides]|nr:hypothetical protein [Adiantum nelumboides]